MLETLDQNQIIFFVTVMVVTAIPVGFFAGLFGIGGGLITVHVLFYIFDSAGLDRLFIMHLAVGTSFAIIIPNTTKAPKLLTISKSTALNFICVIVEINEVGIIIAKEVPTAKCIINDLSNPAESKI